MLIQPISQDAENAFLKVLEGQMQHGLSWCVLYCAFVRSGLKTNEGEILSPLRSTLSDYEAELYVFGDGDMAICWRGNPAQVRDALLGVLSQCYRERLSGTDPSRVFQFYDTQTQGEELRQMLHKKDRSGKEVAEQFAPSPDKVQEKKKLAFTDDQLIIMRAAAKERWTLSTPSILIVEDQEFFRKLLRGLFGHQYPCHVAQNGEQAIQLYAEYSPCITFLDIELPDADGHYLAALIKKHDPDSFIVMVTGNNYVKDVEMAKANKVQGFIAKPYNKSKITDVVAAYMARAKKR